MKFFVDNQKFIFQRLEGQKVNLREQYNAFEFFNTLVDSVDEGLKMYGGAPIVSKTLGGLVCQSEDL